MKVTVEDLNTVKKVLHVEIPADQINKELDKEFKKLKKNAKIKGFRPGKAPRSLLERLYGKNVRADLTLRLVNETYQDAIKESGLEIIGGPEFDPHVPKADEPLCYDMTVEIQPQIDYIDYKGLSLEKKVHKASDTEIEFQIGMLQNRLSETEPIEEDRPARQDDFVLIDYEGFSNGVPHPELEKSQNVLIKIGGGAITPEFDEQMIGMRKGEQKEITATFPKDHQNQILAGSTVQFQVTLNEIRKEKLPEINDELAAKAGPFKSLEELKQNIRANLDQEYAKHAERELNESIYTQLLERTPFDVPETYIKLQLDAYIKEFEASLAKNNKTMEDEGITREHLEKRYYNMAREEAKRYLLINHIIEQEKLELTDEDLQNTLKDMTGDSEESLKEIKKFYDSNPDQYTMFKQTLMQQRAMQLIKDNNLVKVIAAEQANQTDATPAETAAAQS